MLKDEVAESARKIRWFHTIDLGNGIITPGLDASSRRLSRMRFPRDLSGKSVLDVGAWDGFFSFESEQRGAARVLATDSYAWDGRCWADKRGFDFAHEVLRSKIESQLIDVLDISPQTVGDGWDVVLCLGVLYHMRHPLLALERVASVTRGLLILETEVDDLLLPWPSLAFYPGKELGGDPTNWFGPNALAVEGMLKSVGFQKVERVWQSSLSARLVRAARKACQNTGPVLRELWRDRITFHAWK
jgi:tRNA (mo5U34)-methyltransferase